MLPGQICLVLIVAAMRMNRGYYRSCFFLVVFICAFSFPGKGQVPADINSGNPKFPFPQFLPYENKDRSLENLGTKNAPGVTHADMEKSIREAYQIVCNRIIYTGEVVAGVRYLRQGGTDVPGGSGDPCTCAEADGYYLLAAAYMADKTVFDGLYMQMHDRALHRVKRFIDGEMNSPDYPYSTRGNGAGNKHAPYNTEGGAAGNGNNIATDGDVDVALALLVAHAQWGENSGIILNSNGWNNYEINYKEEAKLFIASLADTLISANKLPELYYNNGVIGMDGYFKDGDSQNELSSWFNNGTSTYKGISQVEYPATKGGGYVDYFAPSYVRQFSEWFEKENYSEWCKDQFIRAEASSDWIMGQHYKNNSANIPLAGHVKINDSDPSNPTAVLSDDNAAEDVRHPWRHLMNYVWHGNPEYTWDPVAHEVTSTPNSFEYDMGIRYARFLKDFRQAPWSQACDGDTSSNSPWLSYFGPTGLQTSYNVDGSNPAFFFLNWIQGTSSPAAVIAQDTDLMGTMFRQCEIIFDAATEDRGGYPNEVPVYFHEWFRLLGMLILSGNYQAPLQMMDPESNLRVYMDVDKTFAFTGDVINYTISYRNYSSLSASNVVITDNLPAELEFVSATGTYSLLNGGRTVSWEIPTVPGFTSASGIEPTQGEVTLQVRIVGESGIAKNVVNISNTNGPSFESNEYPNLPSYQMKRNWVDIANRSLIIDKFADNQSYNPGDEAIFTIAFENTSEAGFLDGGRPNVTFSYAHNLTATTSGQLPLDFRLFHDAHEAYIDYGNYRLAYFVNSGFSCLSGEAGCSNGWQTEVDYYEGGDKSLVSMGREDITPGSDNFGSWNQKITLQFAPEMATTSAHLKIYSGQRKFIHRGGLKPLYGQFRIHANYVEQDWGDDWSYDPNAERSGDLLYPVNLDLTIPGQPRNLSSWGHNSCEIAPYTVDRILVEEFDGYVWRRVAGNSPLPGRDVENVVILDTLPVGLTFKEFIGSNPFDIAPQLIVAADGTEIIRWTIPKLRISQKSVIQYAVTVDFPSGNACQTDDEIIVNKAFISGATESWTFAEDTIAVTCQTIVRCPESPNFSLVSDKPMYSQNEQVSINVSYTQLNGSINKADFTDNSEWMISGGSSFSLSGGKLVSTGSNTGLAVNRFSHGLNTLGEGISGHIDMDRDTRFSVLLRSDGVSVDNGIVIVFYAQYASIALTVFENGTEVSSKTNISDSKILINANSDGKTRFDFKIQLVDGLIKIWLGDTDGLPKHEFSGLTYLTSGYAGFANGVALDNNHGTKEVTRFDTHLDSGFGLQITAKLPEGLTNPTNISDLGTYNAVEKIIDWNISPETGLTYIPYGTVLNRFFDAVYSDCSTQTIVSTANLRGLLKDQIGNCLNISCSQVLTCTPPSSVSITEVSPVVVNEGETATLTATTDAPASYIYTWILQPSTVVLSGAGKNQLTTSTAGTYVLRVADPVDTANASCYLESAPVEVQVVTPCPTQLLFYADGELLQTNSVTVCPGQTIALTLSDGTPSLWEYDMRKSIFDFAPLIDGEYGDTYTINITSDDAASYGMVNVYDNNNQGDCRYTTTFNIIAGTIPVAAISTTGSGLEYCEGGTGVTLTASDAGAGATYTWNGPVTGTGIALENATAGSYTVTVNLNGCEATSSPVTVSEVPSVQPTVAISQTPSGSVCDGLPVTFAATVTNEGASPAYSWYLNRQVQSLETGAEFTRSSFQDGDEVYVVLSTETGCGAAATAFSDTTIISVIPAATPFVSIAKSPNGAVCPGEEITFAIDSISNQGEAPVYTWYLNNIQQTSSGTSLSGTSFSDGDRVYVELASSLACASPAIVNSNVDTAVISGTVTPTVQIGMFPEDPVCSGDSITFSVVSEAGMGANPQYQWYINDVAVVGEIYDSFISTSLSDGNRVHVLATSSSACASPLTATSLKETALIYTDVVPSVSISQTTADPVCPGQAVGFSVTAETGQGTSPYYRWYVNSILQPGENSRNFSGNSFSNGDQVYVVLNSSAGCASPDTAVSNIEALSIMENVVPSVTIIKDPADPVCPGDTVRFMVSEQSGQGTNPQYEWYVNNLAVGETSNAFFSTSFQNGDQVHVELTSSEICPTPRTVISNTETIVVSEGITPTVSISKNPADAVCPGDTVWFSISNQTGQGINPQYQWYLNDVPQIGETGITYRSVTFADGDEVFLELTSDAACATIHAVYSDTVAITMTSPVEPTVNISALPGNSVCAGDTVVFQVLNSSGGGTSPVYQWYLNNIPVVTGQYFASSTLADADSVYVVMTSSACVTESDEASGPIHMTVQNNEQAYVLISLLSGNVLCETDTASFRIDATGFEGDSPVYTWKVNGAEVASGENYSMFGYSLGTYSVTVDMTSSYACLIENPVQSDPQEVTFIQNAAPAVSVSMTPDGPVCPGTEITFAIETIQDVDSPSYSWYVNDILQTGETDSIFKSSSLSDQDRVYLQISTAAVCAYSNTARSDTETVQIIQPGEAEVIISANPGNSICTGDEVEFGIETVTGGGASPSYQWYLNNVPVNTGPEYSNGGLADGDSVHLVMIHSDACSGAAETLSSAIYMSVSGNETPSVSIAVNPSDTICEGEDVSFSIVSSTHSGSSPSYIWKVNNVEEASGPNFSSSTLRDGDRVSLEMTSSLTCVSQNPVESSAITMEVMPELKPSVVISKSPQGQVCQGEPVSFIITSVENVGDQPEYRWYLNGVQDGSSAGYSSSSLSDGDAIYLQILSSEKCLSSPVAFSDTLSASVTGAGVPSVTIALTSSEICTGDTVVAYVSDIDYAGSNPDFDWRINGITVSTDTILSSSTLNNNDVISLNITSSLSCLSDPGASSNEITVLAGEVPEISVQVSSSGILCSGSAVNLTASGASSWQWYRNDTAISGATANTYTAYNEGVYTAVGREGSCAGESDAQMVSNDSVYVEAGADVMVEEGGSIQLIPVVSGPIASYIWSPGSSLSNPASPAPVASPDYSTTYQIVVSSANGCTAMDEVKVIVVKPLFIPNAFTPNGDGIHDDFRIEGLEKYGAATLRIFNRWGNVVFDSSEEGTLVWNGFRNGESLPVATYYYILDFNDGSEPLSGSVLLSK